MKSKTTADLPSLRDLLDAGSHFGHRKEWSKPAARKFTFVIRDGVCVIDLEQTQTRLLEAATYLEELASKGGVILLVGTKRQARPAVEAAAKKVAMPFVTERWLGGTLTNFEVIRSNIQRLASIEQTLASEKELTKFTKRERFQMAEQAKKLHATLDGIATLTKQPNLMLVVDPNEEATAVHEARRMGVPVMAICDTNSDPDLFDLPIPANSNAPKSVELILTYLTGAIARGQGKSQAPVTKDPVATKAA